MLRVLSLALVVAVGAPAASQSLGEAAKKEKERREANKGGDARVITEQDLSKADGKSMALPQSGKKAPSASPAPVARSVDESDSASADAELRERAASLRSKMANCQVDVASAERALKAAEDHAWKAGSSYQANSLVENAKTRLEDARRRCDAIEDEARRQGIPPGYLR